MPKKKIDKKAVKEIEKKPETREPKSAGVETTKTIKGKLVFRRIYSSGTIGFKILSDDLTFGEHVDFVAFLPVGFDITKYEITGSVTYKINVKKK